MRLGMLNPPPVDHHYQQHYEAEQSESWHHHQGDDPHHPAHTGVRGSGHVGQDGPVWKVTHAHGCLTKKKKEYSSDLHKLICNFKVLMSRISVKLLHVSNQNSGGKSFVGVACSAICQIIFFDASTGSR